MPNFPFVNRLPWLVLCLLTLLLLACSLSSTAPSVSLPESVPQQVAQSSLLNGSARRLPTAVEPAPFAPYTVLPATEPTALPAYLPTLATVYNPAALPLLSDEERSQLETQGFLIRTESTADLWAPLNRTLAAGEPLFIGSDLVLLATAAVHQNAWQQAQNDYLYSQLHAFTSEMVAAMQAQWQTLNSALEEAEAAAQAQDAPAAVVVNNTAVLEATAGAAWRNWVYFSIAAKLLDPSYELDPVVADMAESELALVDLGGEFVSPLLGDVVNYTILQTAANNYDRTMRWYKQMGFSLDTASTEMLIHGYQVRLLLEDRHPTWDNLYTTEAFFAGNNAPSLHQWRAIADLTAEDSIDTFILTANQLPLPIFYILPPPLAADTPIINGLTYNRVGSYTGATALPLPPTAVETTVGPVRLFPSTLDIPAVLGSGEAFTRLEANGDTAYAGFEGQFAGLRNRYVNLNTEISYGEGWLYALQPLLTPVLSQRPLYMTQPAWQAHQLAVWQSGWLASHLAIAAPLTAAPLETVPAAPMIMIEPQTELYGRLAAQTRQLLTGLGQRGLLSQPTADQLAALETTLYQLQALGRAQMAGVVLTETEQQWLHALPHSLHSWTAHISLPQSYTLYTDPATNRQMVVSLTGVNPLYILTLINGRVGIATGVVLEFEESFQN